MIYRVVIKSSHGPSIFRGSKQHLIEVCGVRAKTVLWEIGTGIELNSIVPNNMIYAL